MCYIINNSNRIFRRNSKLIFDKFKILKSLHKNVYGKDLNNYMDLIEGESEEDKKMYDIFSQFFPKQNFILFSLKFDKSLMNSLHSMHGGAQATILDVVTTIGVSAMDKTMRHNVSSKLALQYLQPIKNDPNLNLIVSCSNIEILSNNTAICESNLYSDSGDKYHPNRYPILLTASKHVKGYLKTTWDKSNKNI